MIKLLSVSASVLFHPMLMPLYGFFLIFNSGTHISFISLGHRSMIYAIIFASSCALPLTMLILFRQLNFIKTFRLESNRERIILVFFTGVFYFLGYLILKKLHLPLFLYKFILGSLLALYLSLIITLWWKISLHMIGIGGITGAIVALSISMGLGISVVIITLIVISGIVGASRLYLNAHTPLQVFAGFFLGFFLVGIIPLL
ncbi:MAG: phosphatase PAP2 family protein [Marinilabiliaceae bacterium]|nr:phosphatase PAP2 family protein [Marinilabiliaceae bacterium]